MSIPVGTASIQIKPSFVGFSKTVSAEVRKSFPVITKEAGSFGKAMADGFSQGSSDIVKTAQDISAKVAKAKSAQEKASKDYKAAVDKEADAVGKLRVAQEKLKEVQEDSSSKASALAQAQERVATETRKVETASKNSKEAQARLKTTTDELTEAEKELKTATDKANKELEDSKTSAEKGKKGFEKLGDQVDKTKGRLEKFGSFLKGAFVGAIAAVSFQGILSGMKEVMDLAGEAEQSVGAVDAVFKGGAGQVHQNAKGAVLEVGLSQKDYNLLATQFGTQLKNAGVPLEKIPGEVDRLIRQAADLSALHGGTTQEAADAMASAFRGEFDPIERYGISMRAEAIDAQAEKMGFEKEGKSFGQNAKVAASMELMNIQGADAKGAYKSEDGTYAQQMQEFKATLENLKIEFGQNFLPIASQVVTFLTEKMVPAFQKVSDWVKEVAGGIKRFADENSSWIGPLTAAVGGIAAAFTIWATAIGAWRVATMLATGAQWLFNAALAATGIPLLIMAIGALVGVLIYLWNTNEGFRTAVTNIWNGIVSFFQTVWTNYLQPIFQAIGNFIMNTLVPAFLNFWHGTIVPVWNGVCQVISNAWNNFIKPVLTAVWGYIRDVLAPAFVQFWTGTIIPVWNGIVSAISNAWNNYIWPTLQTVWDYIINTLAPVFMTLFKNYVSFYFNAIKTYITIVITVVIATLKTIWAFIRDVLAPTFVWLYQNVIVPVWNAIKLTIAIVITVVVATLKILWAFIRDVLAPVFRWLYQTVIVPVWNAIKSFISGAWSVIKTIFTAIRDFIHNVLAPAFRWFKDNVIVPVWNGIKRAIQVVWDGIKAIFNAIKSFMENVLAPAFRWLRDNVIKPVWDAIKRAIQVAWDGIRAIFTKLKQFLENTLAPAFRWFRDKVVKPVWDGIKRTISNVWTNGIKPIFDKLGKYVKETLPDLFRKGADAIGRVWSSVKNLLATPINWVIDNVINKGIVDTFNSVSSKLGLDAKLSRVGRIATASKLEKTSNGPRLGKGKTSVGMYDVGGYTGPGHKYQAAGIVHAGEFVLRKEATNALMNTIGLKGLNHMNKTGQMPGFSDGGLVPELNPFKRLTNSIEGKIREKFPRAGMVIDLLVGSAKKLAKGGLDWLKNKTKDMFTVKAPAGGGGPITSKNVGAIAPAAIRRLAEQALRREGVYSAANMASFLRRMHQESGFNPNAVNLWDSNAKRGWPSQGLMQTIPPTFQTFRDKSLSNNIKDPFANMVAAIRYTKWRYGNVRSGWDKRGGYSSGGLVTPAKYDSGGWLQPGLQAVVNKTRKPEPILTNGQWNDISAIAQRGMTSGGDFYEINVPHLQATGDDVAQAIAYHSRINRRR